MSVEVQERPVGAPTPQMPPAPTPDAPTPTAPAAAPVAAARARPRIFSRRVLLPVAAVVVLGAAIFGFNTYREGQLYVSTENAQLTGQPVQVGSMNAGRVVTIPPAIGSVVHKG